MQPHCKTVCNFITLHCVMKKIIIVCSFLFISLNMQAQNYASIDSVFKKYTGENTPGASLKIIKDGKALLTRSYGMADLETRTPVVPTTDFRLASVTKQFTATCILLLIEEGKLSLNTSLTDMFAGFPNYGKDITVRQLLTHTSGLRDYEDFVSDTAMNPQVQDAGVLEIMKRTESTLFVPGTQYQYSNTGYALLALAIEKYSGQTFANYLKSRIFDPLKMNHTLAYQPGKNDVPDRAYGYTKRSGKWIRKDQSSTSAVLGDGGIYSNVEDLQKWNLALDKHSILSKKWQQEAFTNHHLYNAEMINYGYGWHLKQLDNGEKIQYHTGSTSSFRNIIYRNPKQKLTIIILTNRNQPEEEDMVGLAEKVLKEFAKTN